MFHYRNGEIDLLIPSAALDFCMMNDPAFMAMPVEGFIQSDGKQYFANLTMIDNEEMRVPVSAEEIDPLLLNKCMKHPQHVTMFMVNAEDKYSIVIAYHTGSVEDGYEQAEEEVYRTLLDYYSVRNMEDVRKMVKTSIKCYQETYGERPEWAYSILRQCK